MYRTRMTDLTTISIDGAKLKTARERADGGRGITQETAGLAVGVGKAAISKYERGSTMPSGEILVRLCALYEIEVSQITKDELTIAA